MRMALLSRAGNRISFRLICSCTKVRSKESTHLLVRFSIPALYTNRLWRNLLTFAHKQKRWIRLTLGERRNLTLPELTHSHALKPWDSAVTRRLGASARVLPSRVLLYAAVPETAPSLFCLKLSRSVVLLVQRTALKLLPTGRLASGTSVSLLKEQSINQS